MHDLTEYDPIIKTVLKKYVPYLLCEYEDMMQIGYLCVLESLNTYKREEGPLSSWLYLNLKTSMIKSIFRGHKRRCEEDYYTLITSRPDLHYQEHLSPYEEISLKELKDNRTCLVNKIINELKNGKVNILAKSNRLNARLMIDHHIKGMSIYDMMPKYKMSYVQITHRLCDVREYLRRKYKGGQNG